MNVDVESNTEVLDLGLWGCPPVDQDTAVSASIYVPIGSWMGNELQNEVLSQVGTLLLHSFLELPQASNRALCTLGYTDRAGEQLGTAVVGGM
jgi:hypothetical protein